MTHDETKPGPGLIAAGQFAATFRWPASSQATRGSLDAADCTDRRSLAGYRELGDVCWVRHALC